VVFLENCKDGAAHVGIVNAVAAGPTCDENAVPDPAALVAVAQALKYFPTSPETIVYVPLVLVVLALNGSDVRTGLVPLCNSK
jgi:hypothetical protein